VGTPKLPVVFDPRTQKFYYDLPLGDIKSITTNPAPASSSGSAGVDSIDGQTGVVTLADINLDSVDNTSDADKPVSTAQQTALDAKADATATTTALAGKADASALTSKADLVNGTVPTSQLPSAALSGGLTVATSHAASFDSTDAGQLLEITSSLNAHVLVTFNDESSSDGWSDGDFVEIQNVGAGKLEIFPLGNVATQNPGGFGHLGQGVAIDSYGKVRGRRRGQQVWIFNGDLVDNDWLSYTVTTTTGAYVFNGEGLSNQNNPTLTAKVGQQIAFSLSATGHPFWIATTQTDGAQSTDFDQTNFYVNGNGADSGMVKFRGKTAGTYYYNCQYHSSGGMYGEIVVT
jgi:plastocyanin